MNTESEINSEKLVSLFNLIPEPAYMWRKCESGDLKLTRFNATALRISSGKIQSFIGCSATDFFSETPSIVEDLNSALQSSDVIIRETAYRFRSTGDTSQLEVHCARISSNEVVAIARRMDGQLTLSQALADSESQYKILTENLHDGVVLLDKNGVIRLANAAFCNLMQNSSIIGQHLLTVVRPELRPCLSRWLTQYSEDTNRGNLTLKWNPDVRSLVFEVSLVELAHGMLLQFHNVTTNRQLEDEIARRQRMEAISSVARQIAHDFNNFLSPMIGIPDVLRMRIKLDPNTEKLLGLVQSAAQHMSEINSQLMCLSRIAHPVRRMLNITELVQTAVSMSNLPETIHIQYHLSPESFLITGDESQLLRILTNMIKNALEAMQNQGNIEITTENISLDKESGVNRVVPPGDYVRVSITDTGPGVSVMSTDSIFDPFFSTKQSIQKKGLGLGLCVVAEVMAEHRGFVDFRNIPEGGACFQLYFPIQHIPVSTNPGTENLPLGTESILIVDDNPIYLEVLSQMLINLGYTVETSESGESALSLIQHNSFDLVILDMIMQCMDGAETYQRILSIRPGQRAIIISAYSDNDRVHHARHLGIEIYLTKPVNLTKLAIAVRKSLDSSQPNMAE